MYPDPTLAVAAVWHGCDRVCDSPHLTHRCRRETRSFWGSQACFNLIDGLGTSLTVRAPLATVDEAGLASIKASMAKLRAAYDAIDSS